MRLQRNTEKGWCTILLMVALKADVELLQHCFMLTHFPLALGDVAVISNL